MIDKHSFDDANIRRIIQAYGTTYELTQRAVFALGLVEALRKVGLPFIFKGGSSLMLLFQTPKRLSTDVDILVDPQCEIEPYIEKVSHVFPFLSFKESHRKTTKKIAKRHFRLEYASPRDGKPLTILLDVLYGENHYQNIKSASIDNDLLLSDDAPPLTVQIPSVESLLGDKLTAFAPHTIGVPFFGENYPSDKRLEVIKQFYDVGCLYELARDFDEVKQTYLRVAKDELYYRGDQHTIIDCLRDSFSSALSILSLGRISHEDYLHYLAGFRRISEHVLGLKLNPNNAYPFASRIMLLSADIASNSNLFQIAIDHQQPFLEAPFNKINRLQNIDSDSFDRAAISIKMMGSALERLEI